MTTYATTVSGRVLHPAMEGTGESVSDLMARALGSAPRAAEVDAEVDAEMEAEVTEGRNTDQALPQAVPSVPSPAFMPPAREINEIIQQHQRAVETTHALRKALNAIGGQAELVAAVIARPGVQSSSSELVFALETMFRAQREVAGGVARALGLKEDAPGVLPRLIRAVTPMITAAWKADGEIHIEALTALAIKTASLTEAMGADLPLEVASNVDVDRSLAIYSASLRVARGVDEMIGVPAYEGLSPVVKMIMTGGEGRDMLMRRGCSIVLEEAQRLTEGVLSKNAPEGVSSHEEQIVFRSSLRVASQFAEAIMQYEGLKSIHAFIRDEMNAMKDRDVRFDQVYPHGAFSAWLSQRLRDRLGAVPAFNMTFRSESHASPGA